MEGAIIRETYNKNVTIILLSLKITLLINFRITTVLSNSSTICKMKS